MSAPSSPILTVRNNGQEITETNYWDGPLARAGFCFLSWNAGAGRLLLCDALVTALADMRAAHAVIVSRGPWAERGVPDAIEMLFEDGSDAPYSIQIASDQCDRMLPRTDQERAFVVTVWTRYGLQLSLPGRYRVVARIPCLEPWVG